MDPRIAKMADVLVNYSTGVKPGDWVVIQTGFPGEPLAQACAESVLRAGGNPSVMFASEEIQEATLRMSNDEQLGFISPLQRLIIEDADVSIGIMAPRNTRAMANADPAKMALRNKAGEPLTDIMWRRMGSGEYRWTFAAFPTSAGAQDASMSLHAYEDFVYSAGLLGEPNPAAAWQALAERQQRVIDWLAGKSEVHITGPGTDLTLSVAGRTWINDSGHFNFPGGEVFTAPVETSVQGEIQFTFPAFLAGREVTGVRLVYSDGVVTEATASGDEPFLREMLDMDAGARRIGEFAIGTNPGIQQFTKNTLFDEKIGGTLHMALGRSIPGTGGENVSALHWDMVYNLRDGAKVTVDGELLSQDGEFCI